MYPSVTLKEPEEEAMSASLSHIRAYYHFRIFYLTTQLDYLNASEGVGPWDKKEVEENLSRTKKQLEQLYDYS